MATIATNPARDGDAATGLGDAFPGGNCSSDITPNANVAQAKTEILHDVIYHNVSALQATLDVVIAGIFHPTPLV